MSDQTSKIHSVAESGLPLRLWPGITIMITLIVLRYVITIFYPAGAAIAFFGGLISGLAIIIWWVFFSRAPKPERWGALVAIIVSMTGTSFLLDVSIATANMGLMYIMFAFPVVCIALVIWAALTKKATLKTRRVSMLLTIILTSGFWIFLRTDGMTGDAKHKLNWRWAETSEERILEKTTGESLLARTDSALIYIEPEWPGFRGKDRNGIVHGLKISSDWSVSPPIELWRRPVGPGCSSMAIGGNYIYTHEQLGEYETVSCYTLTGGSPVWRHRDKARFYDSHAGPGPRSTPALANGRLYTLGGTGILNAIDATNGHLLWSRKAAEETGTEIRTWGICGSPIYTDSLVIVSLSGRMAAYTSITGEQVWTGEDGGSGYSSPQLVTLCNVRQVLLMCETGLVSVDPATGKTIWSYSWPLSDRVLQPAQIDGTDLLIDEEYKNVKRIHISNDSKGWKAGDVWTTPEIKMLYNDFVVHKGYAYGFDGPSMACVNLANGKRTWRGERYRGFQILLADQDVILVLTEKGELALVSADPSKFTELSRIQVLKGKTWNHPAISGDILVVRNSEEMAAYRLPVNSSF